MAKKTPKPSKAKIAAFRDEVMRNPTAQSQVMGIFEDRVDGKPRIIILAHTDSKSKYLQDLVQKHFEAFPCKIVYTDEKPHTTAAFATGSGITLQGSGQFGTLGGVFKRSDDPPGSPFLYGLSNNHVLGNCGGAPLQSPILDTQGTPLGNLYDYTTLTPGLQGSNYMDAALFRFLPDCTPEWQPAHPVGTIDPRNGLNVYKSGAASGTTQGCITGRGDVVVQMCGQDHVFHDVIVLRAFQGDFSQEGDSGSLVMTTGNFMVGILIAKSGPYAYACPIKYLQPLQLLF